MYFDGHAFYESDVIVLFIALFSLITNSWIQGIRFIINSLSPPNFHNFCRPLLYKYSIEILQTIWETFLVHHKIGSSFLNQDWTPCNVLK